MNWKQTAAAAILLGLTAALVVWWLERFEAERLHNDVRHYLEKYDEFRTWLKDKEEEA